jgi:hypothetical protein
MSRVQAAPVFDTDNHLYETRDDVLQLLGIAS